MLHQATGYRIRVHVFQLFPLFLFGEHIEIVEPRLLELPQFLLGFPERQPQLSRRSPPLLPHPSREGANLNGSLTVTLGIGGGELVTFGGVSKTGVTPLVCVGR